MSSLTKDPQLADLALLMQERQKYMCAHLSSLAALWRSLKMSAHFVGVIASLTRPDLFQKVRVRKI